MLLALCVLGVLAGAALAVDVPICATPDLCFQFSPTWQCEGSAEAELVCWFERLQPLIVYVGPDRWRSWWNRVGHRPHRSPSGAPVRATADALRPMRTRKRYRCRLCGASFNA